MKSIGYKEERLNHMQSDLMAELLEQKHEAEFIAALLEMLISQKSCITIWRELLDKCLEDTESNFGILGIVNEEGRFDIAAISGSIWGISEISDEKAWQLMSNLELQGVWKEVVEKNQAIAYNHPPGMPWPDRKKVVLELNSMLGIPFSTSDSVYGMIAMANKEGGYSEKDKNRISRVASAIMLMLNRRRMELDLTKANKALQKSNKELDDFTYIVSHDLKEPLRGISAFSQFLMEDYAEKLDEQGKHYVQVINKSSLRMKSLIDSLLEISRLRRRSNPYKQINLNELLAQIIDSLEYTIKEKNAKIEVQEGLPNINCDHIRFKQVFYNLLTNALKYCDKDRPEVKIGYKDASEEYIFFVADNGIGIRKEDFNKVFTIFQRLHNADQYEGTGAGLTIVKTIVEAHRGTMWLESEVGKGSTFYFTFPKKGKQEKLICTVK